MKKTMKRVFAILMTFAIAIMAIPIMETKAAEGDIVVDNITDNTAPVISNPAFSQDGQTFVQGSGAVVEFTADFSDEGESGLDFERGLVYVTLRSIKDDVVTPVFVEQEDGSYKAAYSVDDLDNTEWYVDCFVVSDKAENRTEYYPMEDGRYWNFFVEDTEGVCDNERNITLNFYDEAGELVTTESVTTAEGEVELAGMLDEIPTYTSALGFLGWKCEETGQMLEDDIIFISTSTETEFNFYPVIEKRYVEVQLKSLNKDGESGYLIVSESYLIENDTTYQELIDMLPTSESVNGCNFVKWTFNEDINPTDVVDSNYLDIYAEYDNYPVEILRVYVDKNGEVITEEIKDIYPAGTEIEDILKKYEVIPADASDETLGWIESYEPGEVSIVNNYLSLKADYEEDRLVKLWVNYTGQSDGYGIHIVIDDYYLVDKTICVDADNLRTYFEEKIMPNMNINHFSGFEFLYWVDKSDHLDDKLYYDIIDLNAIYDMSKVIRVQMYIGENEDYEWRQYIVEPGDVITLPTEYAGYYLTWEGYYDIYEDKELTIVDNKFVVPSDAEAGDLYSLVSENGEKVPEQNNPPADNPPVENPPADNPPADNPPADEEKPVVEMDEEKVVETTNKIKEAIKEAEKNEAATEETKPVQVVVDMKKEDGTVATVVPVEILEAAKGQNVEIVLKMGEYSWTINGKDIKATDLKDINLEVVLNTNNIPSATVEKLAKGQETHQLSLTHNGDFGFKAELTINVGKENKGKYGNLYHYNNDGKLVFMNAGKIDEKGNVSLLFSHASEYVIVISEKAVVAPDTGDNTNIALYVCILLAGAGVFMVGNKRRNFVS